MELKQDRLLALMHKKQMSYSDLAEITKINRATIHRYFTGVTKKVPIERIWPIAFALGTTPQFLMGDTDDPSPSSASAVSYNIVSNRQIDDTIKFEPIIATEKQIKDNPLLSKCINLLFELNEQQLKSTYTFAKMLKDGVN